MDRIKLISFFVLIACLTGNYSFSQQQKKENKPDQYRAIHWTADDGLSWNRSNVMMKDSKGFLWVGGPYGELCRFDGIVFKKYFPDKRKRGTINSNTIFFLKEGSLHNIWIGTGKGLSRYDAKADTFSNFSPLIDSAFSQLIIAPFWTTRDSIYCIEPGSLITAFNIHTLKRKKLRQIPKEVEAGIYANTNKSFFDAGSNSIWKLSFYGKQGWVLDQIFLNNTKPLHYPWPYYRNIVNHPHNAEEMVYDPKRNSIWINSSEGLLEFSLGNKQFRQVEALKSLTKLKDYDRYVGIDIDNKERIWFATRPKGIVIYDPQTEQVRQLFSDTDPQQVAGKDNLHIYCDRDGIVWTSDYSGSGMYELLPYDPLVKQYNANPQFQDSLSNGQILAIIPGPHGQMWLGTADGLNIFDPDSEKFKVLREKDLPGIRGNAIVPLHIDTVRQKAWLAVSVSPDKYFEMDMYEMDIKTRKCRPIVFRDGTKRLSGSNAEPYLVTPYKNGLLVWNEAHHLGLFEVKEDSLFADLVLPSKMAVGRWLLENERLLFLKDDNLVRDVTYENINEKWIQTPHILDSLDCTNVFYNDKDQTHWVSFKNELIHYNKDFHIIKSYDQQDGYNGAGLKFLADKNGNIWFINLKKQICRLDPAIGSIITLSASDGYKKQDFDWWPSGAKDARNNLYFGIGPSSGKGRLNRIYPENFVSAKTSSVYLSSLSINQKPMRLSTGINYLEELLLRYNQNTFSIETGIVDFHAMGKGHIRYKLQRDGKDEDWQYGPAYYTIRYDGLTPGEYKLVMQASNAGNEFNSQEKIINIIVSPPFWQTPWFRVLAILFVLALLYGFIHYRSRRLKERNLVLEQKVMQRTNELNNSLAELKTTQDQLIQSEKMASLGELTSGIAHEIKNPLNFVNNFSEINMELITEIEEEQIPNLDEDNQAQMAPFIKTLKKNLEKINHHGKRIDGIVKGMLQHSRMSNTTKEPVDINALCDESLKLAWHGFRAKEKTFNASFETRFDPDIPQIKVFAQDFGRVMINLINNAFYAVHEKKKRNQSESPDALQTESLYKPSVIVSTKKNGSKIFITVSDNGMGIPSPIMNKIFQPFFTTKPTGEGTGLGLSMSYDIISKSHGGEIKAKSKEGLGTDFEIILPV